MFVTELCLRLVLLLNGVFYCHLNLLFAPPVSAEISSLLCFLLITLLQPDVDLDFRTPSHHYATFWHVPAAFFAVQTDPQCWFAE